MLYEFRSALILSGVCGNAKFVVVLAGASIENAEERFNKDVHPTIVVEGFRESSKKAIEFLKKYLLK